MESSQESRLGDKVVYQIYLRSFNDSNGDGVGDIRGITQRLDYLADLGVDYLWITPFFVSPQNDNGYDVADYQAIDPLFGTMGDLEELISEAGKRGIGIMLDMVFNHTSTSHEWFRRALAGDEAYQDYYIFREGDAGHLPTNWASKFGGPAWEWVPSLGKWYLHLFDVSQADLNWENPKVREELEDVIRFWKGKGVKGFRFDVVNLISKPAAFEDDDEGDGRRFYTDGRHVHEFLKELVAKTGIDGMATVGEMSSTSIDNCIRYSNPSEHELAMTFNFHHLKVDYKDGEKWELMDPDIASLRRLFRNWQEGMEAGGGWNALFWSNHDQPRPVSRFGDDTRYWRQTAEMLATCIHLMRGTPYIYQGEELGMTNAGFSSIDEYRDVESKNYYRILLDQGKTPEEALETLAARSRDNSRTPVQWAPDDKAGFTTGTPWIGIPDNHVTINAEAEVADPDSVWSYYRRLVGLRKSMPLIAEGDIRFLDVASDKVIAYERTLGDERLLVLASFCEDAGGPLPIPVGEGFERVIGNYPDVLMGEGRVTLRPYEALALRFAV
ncbi:MAG: alpha,alpha-phosphotrehalase [Atopobiaceae bacterium]|jgi:trehalose-6-phosphate hydrolase|nr:alpha,alpha-phosphotrehalase [Atopobiaceae bacterium]